MYLTIRASDFSDDEVRVTFALSYLKGSPQDWFQSEISHVASAGGRLPEWFTDYTVFQQELKRLFGPHDLIRELHGFCHGFLWGTGWGTELCTPEKPVPVTWVHGLAVG